MWDTTVKCTRIKLCKFESLDAAYEAGFMGADALGFHIFKDQDYKERVLKFIDIFKYLPKSINKTLLTDISLDDLLNLLSALQVDKKGRIVQMATKIVIEPIFEADFQDNPYGFRPKRNAHQAMDDISLQLRIGKTQVIDADISKYFYTIPHDKLLKLIAKRIVDKHILWLINWKAVSCRKTERTV